MRTNITANVGERLEVSCRVDANPPAHSVYWSFKPERRIRASNFVEGLTGKRQGNQLLLIGVRREHEGLYTCHASTETDLSKLLNTRNAEFHRVTETDRDWWLSKATGSASLRLVVNCKFFLKRLPLFSFFDAYLTEYFNSYLESDISETTLVKSYSIVHIHESQRMAVS